MARLDKALLNGALFDENFVGADRIELSTPTVSR